MICQSILFALAFSSLIVDIEPWGNAPGNIQEQFDRLLLESNDSNDVLEEPPIGSIREMKNILQVDYPPEIRNYIPSASQIYRFFRNEEELLNHVKSFLYSSDSEDYNKFDDEVAFGIVYVANLTFWISTKFRIFTLLYSANSIYNDNQSLADTCNTRFNELVSAFNYFKEKINFFFNMATHHGHTYGNDNKVEYIAKEVLTLSTDFILDEDVLQTKQNPDQYVDRMIKWSSIDDVMINGKAYKTIFPSFKKLFCNCRNTSRHFRISEYYYNRRNRNPLLVDTDGNEIPANSLPNFFGYHYPQFNVCNCRTLEERSSCSSRNDDTGVYDYTNVASSSSNRANDISCYNEKVKTSNKKIASKINSQEYVRRGRNLSVPDTTSMYCFLVDLMDSKIDTERFDLIRRYFTLTIGKSEKMLNVTKSTWSYGCYDHDVMEMLEKIAEIEPDPEENVFSLINFIRKLDKHVSMMQSLIRRFQRTP